MAIKGTEKGGGAEQGVEDVVCSNPPEAEILAEQDSLLQRIKCHNTKDNRQE